jgi:predicted RNase H-like nuclease (RuvC/YqgF family)
MNEEVMQQLTATADRLADAAGALSRVLEKLDAQQEALNAKVDRIVAAVEEEISERQNESSAESDKGLREKVVQLEKANTELKAQAARLTRKTLPPIISCLLSKTGSEMEEKLDGARLDQTLQALTVEQRIAVKAEMARAGMIE